MKHEGLLFSKAYLDRCYFFLYSNSLSTLDSLSSLSASGSVPKLVLKDEQMGKQRGPSSWAPGLGLTTDNGINKLLSEVDCGLWGSPYREQ